MLLRQFAAYLTFLWRSTNQHGVHSPFVYQLVTQAFYNQKKAYSSIAPHISQFTQKLSLPKKKQHLIARVCQYLNLKNLATTEQSLDNVAQKVDLLFIPKFSGNRSEASISNLPSIIHNDTVIVIEHIHQCPNNKQLWKTLQNHKLTTVSIDTFSFGFLFFRKEQTKQHFRIRL